MRRMLQLLISIYCLLWAGSVLALSSETVSGVFHRLLVKGDINVRIHHTNGIPYAVAKGDPADLAYFEFRIEQDELRICIGKGYPHFAPMYVDVWVNDLTGLKQYGISKVSGQQLYSSGLHLLAKGQEPVVLSGRLKVDIIQAMLNSSIEIDGIHASHLALDIRQNASVKLNGELGVCQLNMSDSSRLKLSWMNTAILKLLLKDQARLDISGRVQVLDLEMFDASYFAGRYLRVNTAYVKTHQHSTAEISVERSQHCFALDSSHIDFYNVPLMKSSFMVEHAAVLDLREWTMPYGQEDTSFAD